MPRYRILSDVQQVCLNGHQITDSYNQDPSSRKHFCPTCGEKTITDCPNCGAPIKGSIMTMDTGYDSVDSTTHVDIPLFCDNCGKSFPWAGKNRRRRRLTTISQ